MIRIVTGCNEGYYPRMAVWLDSLAERSNIPYTLVKVGWDQPSGRQIEEVYLPRELNYGAPSETESIQHGSFLNVVPNDDLLIYTDGDMVLQRPFTTKELEWLESFGENSVSAGWNYPLESLTKEIELIQPLVSMEEVYHRFPGDIDRWQMLNVGVLAMRRQAWQRVYTYYMDLWDLVSQTFGHQARQQWLINYVIYNMGMDLQYMPYSMHSHGHFGLQPGVHVMMDGMVYGGGELAAIRHHING